MTSERSEIAEREIPLLLAPRPAFVTDASLLADAQVVRRKSNFWRSACAQRFELSIETYHRSGGVWRRR
jgi:hypothetical protein